MNQQRLGGLAQVYRGRVVLKEDLKKQGAVRVLNVSNITEEEIRLEPMEAIHLEEPELSRFRVQVNDLLVTARGTRFKCGVVRTLPSAAVILSGNLLGLRFADPDHSEYLNIFFRSRRGKRFIEANAAGPGGINLGKKTLEDLMIPMMAPAQLNALVEEFRKGQKAFLLRTESIRAQWHLSRQRFFQCFENGFFDTPVPHDSGTAFPPAGRQHDRLYVELD